MVQGSNPLATVELRQTKKGSSGGFGSHGWMGPRNGAVKFGVLHCGALSQRDRSPPTIFLLGLSCGGGTVAGGTTEKPTLPELALNSLIDTPEKEVASRIGRAMQCESYISHIIVWYRCPMESYPHPLSRSAATARPRRASSRPPARPQPRPPPAPMACAEGVRLRPRLEENGGHASLVRRSRVWGSSTVSYQRGYRVLCAAREN